MSKPVKNLIAASYRKRFGDLDGAVVVNIRGIKSNDNNKLRQDLASKKVKVTVVKNSLAKRALAGTKLGNLCDMLEGPCAMVYGGESVVSVARELLKAIKGLETIEVRVRLMDGQIFPKEQFEALSKYPTRVEAQGQAISLILSPARKIAGQIVAPGRRVASLVKAIQEKKEKEPAAATATA